MEPDGFNYWVGAGDEALEFPSGDWQIGSLAFFRAANPDGIPPTIVQSVEDGSKAIRLAVKTGSYSAPKSTRECQ